MPERLAGCHAVVLAAGAGSRFGSAKLLAPLRGQPLVRWSVEAALDTGCETVTVVLGAGAEAIATALAKHTDRRLHIVHCADWADGLSASLRGGIAALPSGAKAAVVFLGDMPQVSPALGDEVLRAVLAGAPAAYPAHAGQPGHPVALSSQLFPALDTLTGDRGARSILSGLAGVVVIDTDDPGCIADVDTPDDLARLS